MDKYADIRPYNDEEVPAALSRLLEDNDFIDVIAKHNAPGWLNSWPFIARPLVRSQLRRKWGKITTVEQVQQEVAALWPQVTTENLNDISDFRGFRTEFMQLFGFNVEGVDYDAEVDPNVALNNLLD